MAVKPTDLENRSETHESIRGEAQVSADLKRVKGTQNPEPAAPEPAEDAADEQEQRVSALAQTLEARGGLAGVARRLLAAKEIRPPKGIEDGRCWGMGRDASIHVIDGE